MDHSQRFTARLRLRLNVFDRPRALKRALQERSIVLTGAVLLVVCAIEVGIWTLLLVSAIDGARTNISSLTSLESKPLSTISPAEIDRAATQFRSLNASLQRIDRLTALPPGGHQIIGRLPWVGPRYVASRTLLQVGLRLSDAGAIGSPVAAQSLGALRTAGFNATTQRSNPTWLDVLAGNTSKLDRVQSDIATAARDRARVEPALLPSFARSHLTELDTALTWYQKNGELSPAILPATLSGLGSQKPVRYLILFQNPAELRPSGGFPGTMGLVTIDRGQLVSYQIFDGHTLTDAYIAQRRTKRPEPWPIDQYFRQDGFLLHDAGWYADFPRAGSTIMSMYQETDWPAIDGVIAIQPSVVADLLKVTGPLDVDIDGETRHVTADNVYDEIERQRRLIVEGIKPWDKTREVHKEAVADIGEAIIAHLKTADPSQFAVAAKLLIQSANVRDIQAYVSDPDLESVIDHFGWTGRLNPDPATPAVAITFANVALQKSSEFMHPTLNFSVSAPSNGRRTVTLEITVDNTGPLGEDPLYSGFQDWWIQVGLPAGFERITSSRQPQPDPEAPNGGSYALGINPQQQGEVTVVFTMPASDRFLLRRQPGLTTAVVNVGEPSCGGSLHLMLQRDEPVNVSGLCQP